MINIEDLINEELIYLDVDINDCIDSIKFSGEKLKEAQRCNENYINAMVDTFNQFPGVIVLEDGVAMPHSRPETGALKNGLCFVKLKNKVDFKNESFEPVDTIIAVASTGNNEHIGLIQLVAACIENEIQCQNFITKQEVFQFMKNINEKE